MVSAVVIKIGSLGREGLMDFVLHLWVTAGHGGKKQKLRQRPPRTAMPLLLPSCLLRCLCSVAQAPFPRDETLLHQLTVQKMPHGNAHRPVWWRQFLS